MIAYVFVVCTAIVLMAVHFVQSSPMYVAAVGWISLLTGLMPLTYAIYYGRKARRVRLGLPTYEKDAIGMHKAYHLLVVTFIAVGVIGMEIAVRKVGGLWGNPFFLAFHLSLAFGMLVTLGYAGYRHTGVKSPKIHWRFGYAFVAFYLAALTTGTMLLVEKFPEHWWMYSVITLGIL